MRRTRRYESIGLTHIGTVLSEAIGDRDRVREALGVWPGWDHAVGPQVAAAARPVSLRNGVLLVHVRNSVWVQELTAMRGQLLERVRAIAGARTVTELRFRVGELPRGPEAKEPSRVTFDLTAPIPHSVAQAIRRVESSRLRAVLLRVASRWATRR